jgi:hypothetical protein
MCYKASVRVKVSLFRSKCLDKTTILMMEKIERASEGQKNSSGTAEMYLEPHCEKTQGIFNIYLRNLLQVSGASPCKLQDYMPYCVHIIEKVYGCRKCDCSNMAAKSCQFRKSCGRQFQCSSLRILHGTRTTI